MAATESSDRDQFVRLKDWILRLPGVSESPHKLGGTKFQVEGSEFMHSHGTSLLDIRLSKEDQARVLRDGTAVRHKATVHDKAGWVSCRILKAGDVETVKLLVQLAYENAKKTVETHAPKTS